LIEQALEQPTGEMAAPIWRQAAARTTADQPCTRLFQPDGPAGVNERVRNTVINTLGVYRNLWEWWAADAGRTATAATP
jgi:hypothetical protein